MEVDRVDALLRRTAAYGLDDDRAPVDVSFDGGNWRRFLQLVAAHRLSGLLDASVRAGDISLDGEHREDVAKLHRNVSTRVLLLDSTLVRVVGQLRDREIPVRVLKGPALAALYPDSLWRPYVDVDLLVPGHWFADAAEVLTALGYRRQTTELHPGFDRRFGKGATFRRDGAATIDLHRTLVAGPYSFLIDPDALFERSTAFELMGTKVDSLSPEARLIHSCISATLADVEPKLITFRDVVQAASDPALGATELGRMCGDWRIGHLVAEAVVTASTVLELSDSACLPTDFVPPGSSVIERLAGWGYSAKRNRWRRQALVAVPFVPGWSDRVAYARAVLASRSIGAS